MESYNHPAWHPPHHAASLDVPSSPFGPLPRPRHASMSNPSSPYIPQSVPPSLAPGPQRARIWDRSATQRPRTSHGSTTSPRLAQQPMSLYGDSFSPQPPASLSPPPLPQKPQALLKPLSNLSPPIPPKPPALAIAPASRIPLYPTSIPLRMVSPPVQPSEPLASTSTFSPDEKEIQLALALSTSDARRREQELIAQEEEELARALEESRLMSDATYTLDEQLPSSPISLRLLAIDQTSISATKGAVHPPEGESWLHLITPTASTSSQTFPPYDDRHSPHSPAVLDESDASGSRRGSINEVQNLRMTRDSSSQTPPLYTNAVSNLVRNPLPTPSSSQSTVVPSSPTTTPTTFLPSDLAPSSDRVSTSPSLTLSSGSGSSEHSFLASFTSRPSWTSDSSENGSPAGQSLGGELYFPSRGHKPPPHASPCSDNSSAPLVSLDTLERVEEEAEQEPGSSTRPVLPLSANQYVERDMLTGISLGFTLPVISTELLPMAGAMPNVISLPYGRAPVFHFQAPSWRKLLKLMARLSATRVEPTVDAISLAKHDLKLRTVIQFVKIHHSASEWRTILYLTTDYPTPSNVHNPHKYTNGDVTVLPYSFALSPLPTLLRDGPESSMAKYYVVPPTPTTPYPNLPINFPNLAMYLQSAVQDSRRACNDSSSGTRKLAQYIDSCYQTESGRVAAVGEGAALKKGGVGGMIKRVMGRHKSQKSSGGNEEIYDLVTPFVSDEWG